MSFLKITDPAKRDFIVNEFLKTKRSIQDSSQAEKLGDIGLQRELTKLYKPITESQAGLAASMSTALKALPASLKTLTFPQYPSIEAFEEPVESVRTLELGDLATKYLKQYASNRKLIDTTFGIHSKEDGQFYIGTLPITIQGDDVTVGDGKTYTGTPGLWELITMTKPNKSIYNSDDLENYSKILDETNAIRNTTNPNKPRSSRSEKYTDIIKPIWESMQLRKGKGIVILPSDPNALVEMLSLRMAGSKVGNTGAANEAVAICDELLRQGVLDNDSYKAIMSKLT